MCNGWVRWGDFLDDLENYMEDEIGHGALHWGNYTFTMLFKASLSTYAHARIFGLRFSRMIYTLFSFSSLRMVFNCRLIVELK